MEQSQNQNIYNGGAEGDRGCIACLFRECPQLWIRELTSTLQIDMTA